VLGVEGKWYDDWSTERGAAEDVEVDEDGFSDRATQGTEADERDFRSPVQNLNYDDEHRGSPGGRRASVRRWGFGCADLVD
jgi:hypothetical protein